MNALALALALLSTPMATTKCNSRSRAIDPVGCSCLARAEIDYHLCRASGTNVGACDGKYVRARAACWMGPVR